MRYVGLAARRWQETTRLQIYMCCHCASSLETWKVALRAVPQTSSHGLRHPGLRYACYLLRFIIINTVLLR